MKKPILFILALASGLSLASAATSALDGSIFGFVDSTPSRERPAQGKADDSPQALCKEVEVQLDEGYGVSGQETRVICQQNP